MVITFLVLLAVLMLVGTPIFIALAGSVTVAMGSFSHIPLTIVAERLFAGLDKFPLMAIPFFILTGSLMSAGGLSQRIIRLANLLVGRFTGGMGMTAVSASMFLVLFRDLARPRWCRWAHCSIRPCARKDIPVNFRLACWCLPVH